MTAEDERKGGEQKKVQHSRALGVRGGVSRMLLTMLYDLNLWYSATDERKTGDANRRSDPTAVLQRNATSATQPPQKFGSER